MRFALLFALGGVVACAAQDVTGGALPARVELVLLHTADTHSQLFPSRQLIGSGDAARGLGPAGTLSDVGGFARLSSVLRRERARAERVLHLDSGDLFQGSLAFERFTGEPELLAFGAMGVDAQVLGNHELDRGAEGLVARYDELSRFPLLAVNYLADGSGGIVPSTRRFAVLDAGGFRVGVIGVANTGSVAWLDARPNELHAVALEPALAVQGAVDEIRPLVDVVVVGSHLGVDADQDLVRRTSGVDIVLGGHQHLVLDEPIWVDDCSGGAVADAWGRRRACTSRRVPIVHSGAYGRFVGRVSLQLDDAAGGAPFGADPLDAYEPSALTFDLVPVHGSIAEDPVVAELLAPYAAPPLASARGLWLLAFAPAALARVGVTSGDSALGNFAADAARAVALADLALIGASSLRHDLPPGIHDQESLKRVVPFEDPIVEIRITGGALREAMDRAGRSAASRDCRTQVHVAGALLRFACPCDDRNCAGIWVHETEVGCDADVDCAAFGGACDAAVGRCRTPVLATESYALATTRYLAEGGSGIFSGAEAAASLTVADSLLDAVVGRLREAPRCGEATPAVRDACKSALVESVVSATAADAELLCADLACVDAGAGAARDGRIRFEAP